MNRVKVGVIVAVLICCQAALVHAGSVDYLTNQSAEYIRTFSRNAALDAADIVSFNPAGTAMMEAGLHVNFSGQVVFKDYSIDYRGEEFGSTTPTPFLPALYVVYKFWDLAISAAFTVPAGGGSLEFEDGVPYLDPLALFVGSKPGYAPRDGDRPTNAYFKGSSMYLSGTLGVAYQIIDMLSISVSGRLISGKKAYKGWGDYGESCDGDNCTPNHTELDSEKTALGLGLIVGIDFKPIDMINIGIRYEAKTPLEWETTRSVLTNMVPDENIKDTALESHVKGFIENRDLPAVLAAGVALNIIPDTLRLNVSFNYYFINQADDSDDYVDPNGLSSYVKSYDDDYDNGFDLAGSVEWQIIPSLLVSIGYNRSDIGGNPNTYSDFEYALDSNSVGLGARWEVIDNLKITLGFSSTFYVEGKNDSVSGVMPLLTGNNEDGAFSETFNKRVFDLALGIEYKIF